MFIFLHEQRAGPRRQPPTSSGGKHCMVYPHKGVALNDGTCTGAPNKVPCAKRIIPRALIIFELSIAAVKPQHSHFIFVFSKNPLTSRQINLTTFL